MSSYVNIKAIKLITLFVGFVQVYKAPGILPNLLNTTAGHPGLSGSQDRTWRTSLGIWSNIETNG